MIVQVERTEVVVAVLQHHEYAVAVGELAKIPSVLVVVQAFHVGVEPHLSAAKGRTSVALQRDAHYWVLCQGVSLRRTSLYNYLREVFLEEQFLRFRRWVEGYLYHLRLTIWIAGEVEYAAAGGALCQVIFLVACHRGYIETLNVAEALLAVAVNHIIYRAVVVLLEHLDVLNVLAHKHLLLHTYNLVLTVLVEDNEVVEVGTVADKLIFLQRSADKSILAVDIEFLVSLYHLCRLDGVEVLYLCEAWVVLAVFLLKIAEPVGSNLGHVLQFLVDVGNFLLDAQHCLLCLLLIELQYALHLYLEQAQDVFLGHLAHHLRIERSEPFVDVLADGIDVGRILKLLVLVYALLDEYCLERHEVQMLQQFALPDLEFLAQQVLGVLHVISQHFAYGGELRFVVLDDTAVWRDIYLAVGECVERIKCLVRRHSRLQLYLNLCVRRRIVVHVTSLNLSFLYSLQN